MSIAYASDGQHQDTGGKVVHVAPNTTSSSPRSRSRRVMADRRTVASARCTRVRTTHGPTSSVDALLINSTSRTDTYPYIEIEGKRATVGHEATVSKIGDTQLFYLMSRGLTKEEAMALIVRGFIEPIAKGASARVRRRAQPTHRTGDGGLGRLMSKSLEPRRRRSRRRRHPVLWMRARSRGSARVPLRG